MKTIDNLLEHWILGNMNIPWQTKWNYGITCVQDYLFDIRFKFPNCESHPSFDTDWLSESRHLPFNVRSEQITNCFKRFILRFSFHQSLKCRPAITPLHRSVLRCLHQTCGSTLLRAKRRVRAVLNRINKWKWLNTGHMRNYIQHLIIVFHLLILDTAIFSVALSA